MRQNVSWMQSPSSCRLFVMVKIKTHYSRFYWSMQKCIKYAQHECKVLHLLCSAFGCNPLPYLSLSISNTCQVWQWGPYCSLLYDTSVIVSWQGWYFLYIFLLWERPAFPEVLPPSVPVCCLLTPTVSGSVIISKVILGTVLSLLVRSAAHGCPFCLHEPITANGC